MESGQAMTNVKGRFDEIFQIEIEGWCYGIEHFPGEVSAGLIHRVVRELTDSFAAAITHLYAFNVLDIADQLSRAAKYLVDEKQIVFSILAQLPNPIGLENEEKFILAQIVDVAEQAYGGAIERLQKKWTFEVQKMRQLKAA
jgi:hypothetical protein